MKPLKIAAVLLSLWGSMAFAHTYVEPAAPHSGDGIVVKHVYAKPAPSGSHGANVYMTIENHSNEDYVFIGGFSPAAEHTRLYTFNEDGSMRRVNKVRLEPGAKLKLKPHHMHFRVTQLKDNAYEGMKLPICLRFDLVAPALCTNATVK